MIHARTKSCGGNHPGFPKTVPGHLQRKVGGLCFPHDRPAGGWGYPRLARHSGRGARPACLLPNAAATELDYMGRFGISQRTAEETLYEYWLYTVEPNQPLDLLAAPTWNNNPPMFLTYAELTTRTDLTWSTLSHRSGIRRESGSGPGPVSPVQASTKPSSCWSGTTATAATSSPRRA